MCTPPLYSAGGGGGWGFEPPTKFLGGGLGKEEEGGLFDKGGRVVETPMHTMLYKGKR